MNTSWLFGDSAARYAHIVTTAKTDQEAHALLGSTFDLEQQAQRRVRCRVLRAEVQNPAVLVLLVAGDRRW